MAMRPPSPFRLLDLERRIDSAFSELIHVPWGRSLSPELWQPAIDIFETDDDYLVEADLPGVLPEAVKLHVEEKTVVIQGSRRSIQWSQQGRSVRVERAQGAFSRTLQFDEPIDAGRVEHRFEQGQLQIRLPKLKKRATT